MKRNHESEEDYLEKILMLIEQNGFVRSIDIAHFMNFSKPSVSIAMKKLEEKNFIIFNRETGQITLTESGIEIAKATYKKHKMLTRFFESIGVNKEVAEEDACKIEHDLSDETFAALEKYLSKYDY